MKHQPFALISGLLLAVLPCSAQLPPDLPLFPADLKQYLNLTDAELTFIQQASADYSQLAASKQLRILELQNEIAAETQKDQPDPMALGVRYAEIESIRRDMTNQLAALRDKLRASLDDTQRTKLAALNDARNLQPIVTDAQCENLLDPTVPVFRGGQFSGVVISGNFSQYLTSTVSGCYLSRFPQELSQYLTLSSDQANSITSLNTNNQQQTTGRQQDISDLQTQITLETAKDTLDPLALGTLYAQVEDIRRSIANDLTTLRNNARAILNDMQRVKLNSLDDARKLQPLISEATCENLLDPQATQGFNPSTFVSGTFSSGGGFTSLVALRCVSGLSVLVVPTPPPPSP